MSKCIIIAAISNNSVIGIDGGIPWRLPAGLKLFKELTTNSPIVMGRKTYESLGRLLPNRHHIVVTRDANRVPNIDKDNLTVCTSLTEATELAAKLSKDKYFVIGGSSIYKESMDFADEMVITHVDLDVVGDSYFPAIEHNSWPTKNLLRSDCDNGITYSVVRYNR